MNIIEEEVKTKRCSRCGRILPLSEFYKDKRAKDGLRSECKQCNKATQAEYYKANKEKKATYDAEYYQSNKEKIAEYYASYYNPQKNQLGWAKRMVAHYRQMDRDRGFDDKDTISVEWFLQNIAYQPCAHCGKQGIGLIGCNRLDNTKPHSIDTVEPCCFKCNCKENIRDMLERGLHWTCKHKKQSFKDFVNAHKAKDKNLT